MSVSPAAQPAPRTGPTMAQREARLAYAMLLPTTIVVLAIVVFPVIWNLWLAFKPIELGGLQSADLWSPADLTFKNFARVFRGVTLWPLADFDLGRFGQLLGTTLLYTIFGTILSLIMGLAAALLARDVFPGRQIFRGLILFPYIAPVVAVAFVWKMMLNAQFGIINELGVRWFGWQRISFLSQRYLELHLFGLEVKWPLALTMVILFEGWRYFPFAFLFFLSRLQALPSELYEAAAVDGAIPSQRFWYITLPQLRSVFATLLLLRFIWTFNKFDDIFLLTGGGAGTQVMTVQIYDFLFGQYKVGAASALAVVLAIVLAIFLLIYFRYLAVEEE